jgi:hypothetical protein
MRLGFKQLRNKSQLRDWTDIRDMLGDTFLDAIERMPPRSPTAANTSTLGQVLPGGRPRSYRKLLWRLAMRRCRSQPNRQNARTGRNDCRILITRGAVSDVKATEFPDFLEQHVEALQRRVEEHPTPLTKRLNKAAARYNWAD